MRTRPKAVCVLGAALLSMALAAGGSVGARPSQALLLRLGPIRNFQQASNWSGYAQTSSTYAEAKGTWVVPTIVRKSGTALSSQWVGIDGDGNHDLIQTGTQAVLADGQKGYGAWWEILPAPETSINHTVRPGDVMTATIVKDHHGWHITLRDRNRWTFEITRHYTGPGGSIEWIVEAPTIGNQIAPMLHTTPVTFWGEQLNNKAPHLLAKNAIQCVQHGVAVETPSLANSKQAFTMAYGGRPPPPPR